MHVAAPSLGVYEPAGQGRHIGCPLFGWCVPMAQCVQVALDVAPASDEYLPTGQGKHAVGVLLPLNGL